MRKFLFPCVIHTDFISDYWDSYWIIKGLIVSQLYDVVNGTLQNFMDEIEKYGFIPNGGRIYCAHLIKCSDVIH